MAFDFEVREGDIGSSDITHARVKESIKIQVNLAWFNLVHK